jgi:hypothetical protein
MLNIYTNLDYIGEKILIRDCDAFFGGHKMKDTDFGRKVIEKIEQGKYQDEDTFVDRFGRGLYCDCLSTTSKILILAKQDDGSHVFMVDELGSNGFDLLLECENASVYIENRLLEFGVDGEVMVNNEVYDTDDAVIVMAGGEV